MKEIIFSDNIKMERWTGEHLVCFTIVSGDKTIRVVVPEFAVKKLLNMMNFRLDETDDR